MTATELDDTATGSDTRARTADWVTLSTPDGPVHRHRRRRRTGSGLRLDRRPGLSRGARQPVAAPRHPARRT